MRQNIAEGFKLKENKHPFIFENPDGHIIRIMIISNDVIRVQHLTADETSSEEKLKHLPQFVDIKKEEQTIEIETSAVRLVVTLEPSFHLSWYSIGEELPFSQDLPYRSYAYDHSTGNKWHYQRRFKENLYYGLGERSGDLDLSGRRFRLDRLDCMGYDAEKSDPLYKFCPFYINLSPSSKQAYGIYYNNFSGTTIDLGQENDAVNKQADTKKAYKSHIY